MSIFAPKRRRWLKHNLGNAGERLKKQTKKSHVLYFQKKSIPKVQEKAK